MAETSPAAAAAKGKVVVVMGATGAGKSKLSVDLAGALPGVEIVSADSMQVYRGLDVLTNKIPVEERKGVPHHLLDVVDSSAEFTSRDFRDCAVPIIDDILKRGGLPVIVGGTNFYIQALVSPFLSDDVLEDLQECELTANANDEDVEECCSHEHLKEIDPVTARRIHPNDYRKIKRYLSLYASTGVLPSELFQGEAAKRWGRPMDFRYSCCFIWVDAELHVLDKYVDRRVDDMIDIGLLDEVHEIYDPSKVYTRGLRQAIGVREFDEFFRSYRCQKPADESQFHVASDVRSSNDEHLQVLLNEAVQRFKSNTRKLVRRQRRRLTRLRVDFGWDIKHINATEAFSCSTGDAWKEKVVKPCVEIIRAFLANDESSLTCTPTSDNELRNPRASKELWTEYICKACDNRVLHGAHEWEAHTSGRVHRKRAARLKKSSRYTSILDHPQSLSSEEAGLSAPSAPQSS